MYSCVCAGLDVTVVTGTAVCAGLYVPTAMLLADLANMANSNAHEPEG
jgi:hypothetical protein